MGEPLFPWRGCSGGGPVLADPVLVAVKMRYLQSGVVLQGGGAYANWSTAVVVAPRGAVNDGHRRVRGIALKAKLPYLR